MNKIVRDNYPVSNLPDDLKTGLSQEGTVRIVIEQRVDVAAREKIENWAKEYWATKPEDRKPIAPEEMMEQLRLYRAAFPQRRTLQEAVAEVRALRDEWDGE